MAEGARIEAVDGTADGKVETEDETVDGGISMVEVTGWGFAIEA